MRHKAISIALLAGMAAVTPDPAAAQSTPTCPFPPELVPLFPLGFFGGIQGYASQNSIALGYRAFAVGSLSAAIGFCSYVRESASNSVALGSNSLATEPNTVSVGTPDATRRIVNVAAGVNATDAVNVGQFSAVTSTINNNVSALQSNVSTLQTNVSTLGNAVTALQGDVGSMNQRLDDLFASRGADRKEMRSGVASAVAMANAPMPSEPGRTSYVVNGATFRGQQAIGVSLMHRFNAPKPLAIGAGVSYAGGKNTAGRVSVAGEF